MEHGDSEMMRTIWGVVAGASLLGFNSVSADSGVAKACCCGDNCTCENCQCDCEGGDCENCTCENCTCENCDCGGTCNRD